MLIKKLTCEEFIRKIITYNTTIDTFIEEYGVPDTIVITTYANYSLNSAKILYYGENNFIFYINDDENINTIVSFEIVDNLYKYFPVKNNVIKRDNIKSIFQNKMSYEEVGPWKENYYIYYIWEDNLLRFVFRHKESELVKIQWGKLY